MLVGLWSKDLCSAVTVRRHTDENDLLHDLMDQERLHRQRYERFKSSEEGGIAQTRVQTVSARRTPASRADGAPE